MSGRLFFASRCWILRGFYQYFGLHHCKPKLDRVLHEVHRPAYVRYPPGSHAHADCGLSIKLVVAKQRCSDGGIPMRLMVKLSSSPYQQQKSHAAAQCRVREDTDTDQREPSKFPVLLRGITHSNTPLSLLAVSFASDPYGGLVNPAAQSSKTVGLYAGSRGLRFSTALRRRAGGLSIIQAANSLRLRMSTASRRIPIQSPTNTERPNRADANKIQGCEWHERAILAHRSK